MSSQQYESRVHGRRGRRPHQRRLQWAQLPLSLPRRRPFVISDKSFIVAEKPSSVSRARFAGSGEWWRIEGSAFVELSQWTLLPPGSHRQRRETHWKCGRRIAKSIRLNAYSCGKKLVAYGGKTRSRCETLPSCALLIGNLLSFTKKDEVSHTYFDRSLSWTLALRNSVRWQNVRFPRWTCLSVVMKYCIWKTFSDTSTVIILQCLWVTIILRIH